MITNFYEEDVDNNTEEYLREEFGKVPLRKKENPANANPKNPEYILPKTQKKQF